jgi:hypothetical protein
MISVVNVKSTPRGFEYIGRAMPDRYASALGNPFRAKTYGLDNALLRYKRFLWNSFNTAGSSEREEVLRLLELSRKGDLVLGCWCKPKPCHGDTIKALLEYLNKIEYNHCR